MLTKVVFVTNDIGTITKFGFSGSLPAYQTHDGVVHYAGELRETAPFYYYNGTDTCGLWPDASVPGGWLFGCSTAANCPAARIGAIDIEDAFRRMAPVDAPDDVRAEARALLAHYGL